MYWCQVDTPELCTGSQHVQNFGTFRFKAACEASRALWIYFLAQARKSLAFPAHSQKANATECKKPPMVNITDVAMESLTGNAASFCNWSRYSTNFSTLSETEKRHTVELAQLQCHEAA